MIDVHSHIIPKIDDGCPNLEESYAILEEAIKAGFTDIISTSHYIEDYYETNSKDRHAWVEAMNKVNKENNMQVTLHSGSEIYVTPKLVELIKEKQVGTLADSRYVLFELPMNSNIKNLDEIIFEIQSHAMVPVIAHPERYAYVQKDPNCLLPYLEKGVLFQANYGSIIGIYGKHARNTVKQLLQADMIHFLGTDVHKKQTIYTQMDEIMIQLENNISREKIEELSTKNPEKILKNEEIQAPVPHKIKSGIARFFKF